ncbi:DUF4118 domain-containing protein [Dactylosporangium sp. NPDC005572]|uniref:ATP-binding protein n=1 Tax=Dactylosporangium sp. NPDC005572 TaxID=3156889 RepID=UPI0033B30397
MTLLLRPDRPPVVVGALIAVMLIATETAALFELRPAHGGGRSVIYLTGVLVVSGLWGVELGVATSVASAVAFAFFHVPPFEALKFDSQQDLQSLVMFVFAALLTSFLAKLARSSVAEAAQRREEVGLAAELSQHLLRASDVPSVLGPVSQRIADVLGLRFTTVELGATAEDEQRIALPLQDRTTQLGTLLVPTDLPEQTLQRLRQRVVPSLESLLCAACERDAINRSLRASREEATVLMEEQAALRRVATLVARGAPPIEVFDAVTAELERICGPQNTGLIRYEPNGKATLVSGRNEPGVAKMPAGTYISLEGDSLSGVIKRTGRPARMTYDNAAGPTAAVLRDLGMRSGVGVPVVVEGRLWGAAVLSTTSPTPIPASAQTRLVDLTDLLATAIANAHSRAQLNASRTRIVTAADNTRRQLERDLHDGAQQHLISLGLQLRCVEASMPPELDSLREDVSLAANGLIGVCEELREISRGIHPAILSKGGLGPALKTLARRSAVPAELTLAIDRRLPEQVEVTAYYIVSEALTNVAKHARATVVRVDVEAGDATLELSVHDDGIGGADTGKGSGLIGLQDRTEAHGGQLEIISPAGGGTHLQVKIPIGHQ